MIWKTIVLLSVTAASSIISIWKLKDLINFDYAKDKRDAINTAANVVRNEFPGIKELENFPMVLESWEHPIKDLTLYYHDELLNPCSENSGNVEDDVLEKASYCPPYHSCTSLAAEQELDAFKAFKRITEDETTQDIINDCKPSAVSEKYAKEFYQAYYKSREKNQKDENRSNSHEATAFSVAVGVAGGIIAADALRKKYRDKMKDLKDKRTGNSL